MHDGGAPPLRVITAVSFADVDPTNRLLADYLAGVPQATGLFSQHPGGWAPPAKRSEALADLAVTSRALVDFQQCLGADARAVENARLLTDPNTVVITVGQQPGLLTGPLYTPYKALTAINLADRLARDLGQPVVPVFWAGTDDDDRAEVDHCACWDAAYSLQTLRYPEEAGAPGQLVGDLPIHPYGERVLAEFSGMVQGQPHAAEVQELLRETVEASADFGEWFCRLLARLFSGMGLVVCDPRLPELRAQAAEVFRRELSHPLASTAAVNERARELRRLGYHAMLTKPADLCNLFMANGIRRRVSYQDGQFFIEGKACREHELLSLLDSNPERFIPNAVLRPVVQEYLFGSAGFVAGPGELGYWAELSPVFKELHVNMPPVIVRAAATLVPASSARVLHELEIEPLELQSHFDQMRYRMLAGLQPATTAQAFAGARASLTGAIDELAQAMAQVDPTLAQSAQATRQRLANEFERLEQKTLKAVERRSAHAVARLTQMREVLFPGHGLQERTLNIFGAMARYGLELPDHLCTLLDGQESKHLFVEM
ncbi:MAG: bacillithiol biosynthesis cysteine-adding enzyme BshC [Armatimonadota bacterium]